MKKLYNNNKYMICLILCLSVCLLFAYLGCNQNVLAGVSSAPDIQPPLITITSHVNNQDVSGDAVTLGGTVSDDMGIGSVILYQIIGKSESKVATGSVSGNSWHATFNSKSFTDGNNVFKIKVTDTSGKTNAQNITLYIDNYGSNVIINNPEANNPSSPYFNPFTVAVIIFDADKITELQCSLQSQDLPEASTDLTLTGIFTSNYTFNFDPTPLSDKGLSKGYCNLKVRVKDIYGRYSQTDALQVIYIDFTNDIPKISISNPTATDELSALTSGSEFIVTGQAWDDDGIKRVKIWYKEKTQPDSSAVEVALPDFTGYPLQTAYDKKLTGLADGTYLVKAMTYDMNDVTSDYTESHYFKVDTNYPSLEFTAPVSGSWCKGTINVQATVTTTTGNLSKIERSLDNQNWTTMAQNVSSPYSYSDSFNTATQVPNGGQVTYYLRATNSSDKQYTSFMLFNADNVNPTGIIDYPPVSNSGLNQTFKIQGTASDQIGGGVNGVVKSVKLNIQGMGDVTPDGISVWSYNFNSSSIPVGDRTITVTITDYAGNTAVLTRVMHIDQSADIPHISVSNLHESDKIYGIYTITGEASDDDAVRNIRVYIDSDTSYDATGLTSWSYKLDTTLYSQGAHQFHCVAYDIYNKPSAVKTINFTIDPDLPIITYTSHTDNAALKTNAAIVGTVTKTTGNVASIEIYLQSNSHTQDWTTSNLIINGLGTSSADFSYTINTATYGDGPISITIRAKDDIDKMNTKTINLVIDTVDPIGSLTLPLAGSIYTASSLNLAGSCSDPVPSSGLTSSNILIDFKYVAAPQDVYHVVDGSSTTIAGSVSNWTYNWTIPSGQKDGLYKVILNCADRADNTPDTAIEVSNIRLMRYVPQFSNLYISGIPVANNMFLVKDCNFTGHLSDANPNDIVSGVKTIEIYLSDDNLIDAGDGSPIAAYTWTTASNEKDFDLNYTFTAKKQYLIYRAIDNVGGYNDAAYMVNIDFNPPAAQFKYTSANYYPSTQSTNPGYSDSFWVKLDATDDNDLSGSTIQAKLGTTSGGEELVGLTTYTIGDLLKADLHGITANPVYLWYKLSDKAGNQTTNTISLSRDTNPPGIASAKLSTVYLNNAGLSISGTATGGGATVTSVKFSAVDGDLLTVYPASGTATWTYTIPEPAEGDHYIYGLVTANDGTNIYQQFNFTYDKSTPSSTITLSQISGGRLIGNNISGTIRISGNYSDNLSDRYNAADYDATVDINYGTGHIYINIPDVNKTKKGDGTFDWYYDWDSQTMPGVVKTGITFSVQNNDKSGNTGTDNLGTAKDVVPYITYVTNVSGLAVPVYGYNTSSSLWENLNDNKTYTYRRDSGNITINGYNLNATTAETIYWNKDESTTQTQTWTQAGSDFTENMNAISFNLSKGGALTSGYVKILAGGINSNAKKFIVINNYGATNYTSMAETDMVLDDSNNARVVIQKHFQSGTGSSSITRNDYIGSETMTVTFDGSGIFRFKETAENNFSPNSLVNTDFITHGWNRFWLVNVTKVRGTAPAVQQWDGKYYLLTDDSENGEGAAKGIQLTGADDFWDNLPNIVWFHADKVWLPVNDTTPLPAPTPPSAPHAGADYYNRWRMSAANDYAGTTNLTDWSITWADLVAVTSGNNEIVYTAWFSQYDNLLHYRRLYNQTFNSYKSPAGSTGDASITFNIKGMYPSITLDSNNYPVIVCFDETNGDLVAYFAKNADPQDNTTTHWNTYTVDSTGVTGVYPDIEISGSDIHIFYQDLTNNSLKYVYANNPANLSSATKITLDTDSAPGFYCDARLTPDNKPLVTYIAYGYLGTQNAIRTARYIGTDNSYTDQTKWERITLPCANNISENKVRGYYVDAATDWLFGFGKSDRPEFFREKP